MMNDLLKIQSELDRRPKQMKPENKNSQIKEEDLISGIIEPNPYLASPRLFGPKCSTHEWLGGFRAFQLQNDSMENCKYLILKQFIIISFDKAICDLLLIF